MTFALPVITTFALILAGPVGEASAAAPNDHRASAFTLRTTDTHASSNAGATIESGEQLTAADPSQRGCDDGVRGANPDGWQMGATIWYAVVGDGSTLTASTQSSGFDTILAAYRGNTLLGCGDDWPHSSSGTSQVRWATEPGALYHLQLGGACEAFWPCGVPATGATRIWVDSPPANDDRERATTLALGSPTQTGNTGATERPGEVLRCGDSPFGKTVWHRVSAPAHGSLSVTAADSFHDSVIAIYATGSAAPLDCNDDATDSASARVRVAVAPGDYFIQSAGYGRDVDADDGSYVLTAEFTQDFDLDHDGVNGPPAGTDCDDGNPAIRPGLPEIPNNDVDENCDDVRATDGDHDGHVSRETGGGDCDDAAPHVHPGAIDRPENDVDENCDGADATYPRVTSPPILRWKFYKKETAIKIVRVVVTDVAKGTTATVVCTGRGCPARKRQSKTARRDARVLRFDIRFKRKLKRAARVTLSVTRPGHVGLVRRTTVRKRGVQDETLCLWPNESTPRRCGGRS